MHGLACTIVIDLTSFRPLRFF